MPLEQRFGAIQEEIAGFLVEHVIDTNGKYNATLNPKSRY